jgi:chemotaxis protein histidine kinase CheA
MANQLELNEADMESYEAVVNELAEQLTEVSKIKDELTVNIIQLHHEKDEMIREKTEEWAEQKSQLMKQIGTLQESISETNMVKIDCFDLLHWTCF